MVTVVFVNIWVSTGSPPPGLRDSLRVPICDVCTRLQYLYTVFIPINLFLINLHVTDVTDVFLLFLSGTRRDTSSYSYNIEHPTDAWFPGRGIAFFLPVYLFFTLLTNSPY